MLAVNAAGYLRVSEEANCTGSDLHEHGISAYPEYVISALGAPRGMSQQFAPSEVKANWLKLETAAACGELTSVARTRSAGGRLRSASCIATLISI
jgi:hypothetical protein